MHIQMRPAPAGAPVLAFHCSGADSRQWEKLALLLHPRFRVIGIDLYGTRATGHWSGTEPFSIDADAKLGRAALDGVHGPVHLVGHSYGGAVALHVALQEAGRIASLTLYEPSPFHMLKQMGPAAASALLEITTLAKVAAAGVRCGNSAHAAEVFIDYWNGPGAWQGMKQEVRASVLAWFPKAPLDFQAALGDETLLAEYRRLQCPVIVMRGEHAMAPSRTIAETLAGLVQHSRLVVVPGAGHMGPLTHASAVNALIAAHLTGASAAAHSIAQAA